MTGLMERALKDNLLRCAIAYSEGSGLRISTIGRLAVNDWRFFSNLPFGPQTFTVRKYDEAIAWFSSNWPASTAWPEDVLRPSEEAAA